MTYVDILVLTSWFLDEKCLFSCCHNVIEVNTFCKSGENIWRLFTMSETVICTRLSNTEVSYQSKNEQENTQNLWQYIAMFVSANQIIMKNSTSI